MFEHALYMKAYNEAKATPCACADIDGEEEIHGPHVITRRTAVFVFLVRLDGFWR